MTDPPHPVIHQVAEVLQARTQIDPTYLEDPGIEVGPSTDIVVGPKLADASA